jgi:acetyl esterase/lipase
VKYAEVIYARLFDFRPLVLDLYVPDGVARPPVVVWIHGGGFRQGDRRSQPKAIRPRSFFTALGEAGVACATIDYRLTGEAGWPAQREDVDAAIEFLAQRAAQYGIDAGRLGTAGESAGGHLALTAAMTSPRVKAAVAWYPMTDLAALDAQAGGLPYSPWLGAVPSRDPELMAQASPVTYVTGQSPPCLFVHGQLDTVYPPSQSELMHRALTDAGVESVCRIVPDAGHLFYECSPQQAGALLDESVDFLRRRL